MNTTTETTLTEAELYAAFGDRAKLAIRACNTLSKSQAHALKLTRDRSGAITAGIIKAIEHYWVRKLRDLDHCERTGYLMERFECGKYKLFGLKQIPDRETVKKVMDKYVADFK